MQVILTDGGRAEAGFKGYAGDCVARAIAIASQKPYKQIHHRLSLEAGMQRASTRTPRQASTAEMGIYVQRRWFKNYMDELGFSWTATMGIGTGCRVHLRANELPMGRLVVAVSRHVTAVIDGVIHDTHDPSRNGNRCVYGYWTKEY